MDDRRIEILADKISKLIEENSNKTIVKDQKPVDEERLKKLYDYFSSSKNINVFRDSILALISECNLDNSCVGVMENYMSIYDEPREEITIKTQETEEVKEIEIKIEGKVENPDEGLVVEKFDFVDCLIDGEQTITIENNEKPEEIFNSEKLNEDKSKIKPKLKNKVNKVKTEEVNLLEVEDESDDAQKA